MVGLIIVAVGVGMVIVSLTLYIGRTGDKSVLKRFWASSAPFSVVEFWMHRLGVFVMFIGLGMLAGSFISSVV